MRGLLLMGLGFLLFSTADTQAKLLTDSFHPVQIAWSRQLGLLSGVVIALAVRGPSIFHTRHPALQIARGLLAVISATCFIFAVKFVPLADAVAVSFVAPFMVTAMGALLLGERVGPRRWSAVIVGFLGTLIVIRPGMGVMHPAVLLVLVAATAFAARQVVSRLLASSDRTVTTVAYTALASVLALSLPLPFLWTTPATEIQWALLFGMAAFAAVGELLIIKSLEIAQASVLAPMHYSLIIWGTFWGWLIFGQLPDLWTWIGAIIIVATGLYLIHRERMLAAGE
ncbi:DMT family transporter [Tropicimonas sp. TH_r6]|uniref:DMT family transporter n=1 Tax=Tropicimonas sp. TH_r6 TaxID=3082085 RepID=UPI00295560FC|nr:DMT family transporter [Tropicimonas sp. TH_r6]